MKVNIVNMEISLEVPQNMKNTLLPSYTPPGCLPKEFHILLQGQLCIHICSCSIHNSKEMEPA